MANNVMRGGKGRKLALCTVLIDYYNVLWLTRC
jgi:hypothetical protein